MPRFLVDIIRVVILVGLTALFLLWMSPANIAVVQAAAIGTFWVGVTHITRRIMFHKLDVQLIAHKAVADANIAAAIVFASICAVLVAIMYLATTVVK